MSIELVILANHLILCCLLLLLPSVFPNIRVYSSELALCIWWPKYRSFSISINPSNEYPELISFRIDWFNLLADQGTLKSLHNHNWKVSVLQHSSCLVVQCSHLYTFSSVTQSCPTLRCMDGSTPVLPVHHQLLELVQTHVHRVSDAIKPSVIPFSHFQSFPASESFQMSHFFTSGGQSIRVSALASVLPMSIQDWFPLGWTCWISLQSRGLSSIFSNTTVQKNQFFSAQLSLQSNSHMHTWLLEKP